MRLASIQDFSAMDTRMDLSKAMIEVKWSTSQVKVKLLPWIPLKTNKKL